MVEGETGKKECKGVTPYSLNLENVRYVIDPRHRNLIELGGGVGVKMKYPSVDTFTGDVNDDYEAAIHVIVSNIDCIYDDQGVYKDFSKQELIDFIEELEVKSVQEMRDFFSTQPKVVLEDQITCKKCGYVHTVSAESLYGFFI